MFSDPGANLAKLVVTDGMRVADLGAGSGFYTIESAKRVGASGRVYAIDVQKSLLERIRTMASSQRLANVEVVWANAEKIGGTKLKDALVDRAIVSNILFQVAKQDDFALECKRIVKPGGKLMVIEWSGKDATSPQTLIPQQKAQQLFEKSGFRLESTFPAGYHHYGMIFART